MTLLPSKRMDGARSSLIHSAAVFSTEGAHTESRIIDTINAFIGPDKEQETACDLAIRKHRAPKFFNFTLISIVEARDSGLPLEKVQLAVAQLTQKELSDVINFTPSMWITKAYYEKRQFSIYPENILLAMHEKQIVGFLIAIIKKQEIRRVPLEYCVQLLAIDSSYKRGGFGTQLLLTAMSKASALKMPLALTYSTYSSKGEARHAFYDSFTPKFGIPTYTDGEEELLQRFPVWDLEGIQALSV